MKEDEGLLRNALYAIISVVVVLILVGWLCKCDDAVRHPRPINHTVDSLLNTNDSIKIVIKYIDSTKHEEIEKVLKLDNDSTLELFKQLVRE